MARVTKLEQQAGIEDRRDKVMALVRQGGSTRTIAKALECAIGTVHNDVKARLKYQAENCPNTTSYRELNRQRIEDQLMIWWPKSRDGDHKAAAVVIRLLEEQNKLLGLYKPVLLEVQPPALPPEVPGLTIDVLPEDDTATKADKYKQLRLQKLNGNGAAKH